MKEKPKKDFLIIQGDFNAKVGKDAHIELPACAGRFGIGHQNKRGQRLLEFAKTPTCNSEYTLSAQRFKNHNMALSRRKNP